MDPLVIAAVYVGTGIVIVPIGFEVFKTPYKWFDVVRTNLYPDIIISVAVARLSVIPVMLLLSPPGS